MPVVVVEVMLKPEILDPQGQAIAGALVRLGFDGVRSVRQGKRFVLDIPAGDGPPEPAAAVLDRATEIAGTLLANPVIEDFRVHLADPAPGEGAGG